MIRTGPHVKARAQRLEMLIGILGFFTAGAFTVTVVAELRGQPALRPALVLLGFVVLLGVSIRLRLRLRS
jgi:hypothetical protein